jgi:hypothetical protein
MSGDSLSRRKKPPALPPDETPDQVRARLRRFALATRDRTHRAVTIPFPEHISVLAGPLRRVSSVREPSDASLPDVPAGPATPDEGGDAL